MDRLNQVLHEHALRNRFYNTPMTLELAKVWVMQHRLNNRMRNSVLKLSVATNCPHWDIRIRIIGSCAEEVIADHEFAGGRPHYEIIEDLGVSLGLTLDEIRNAQPLPTTQIAWLAWEALTKNRHWLEGLVANTCTERFNLPGYGIGLQREVGRAGVQRKELIENVGLRDDQLEFFKVHGVADVKHSNVGWESVARYAEDLNMGDAVVEAARINLKVWELFQGGICDAAEARVRERSVA